MSSIVNKVKEALHSDKHSESTTHNQGSRVESDVTGSRPMGTTGGMQGENFTGQQAPEGTYGQHKSRMANAVDPRIDSDRDGSRTTGTTGTSGFATTGGNTMGTTGREQFGTTGQYGNENFNRGTGTQEGNFGPHSSRMANAADPRVDSDRDGSRTMNPGFGSGPAPNTAGHHKSDVLNKVDPRVDSNLDGSRTLGGNNNNSTYNAENTSNVRRDPTDASQVPPSVLRQHLGEPAIQHEDDLHNRDRRHRKMSHQEEFIRGS